MAMVSKVEQPVVLDLFCGAGGAGAGYQRAGYHVIGVDIEPQRNNPHQFIQGDWREQIDRLIDRVDLIHASPQCQPYTPLRHTRTRVATAGDELPKVDRLFFELTKPYVIENVPGSPLRCDLMLCGSMFDLLIKRHRIFKTSIPVPQPEDTCKRGTVFASHSGLARLFALAMEVPWMTTMEARQAVPPRYTEYIGRRFMQYLH